MEKKLLLAATLFTALNAMAQTERFDIASFVPPQGWNRLDSNGTLSFMDIKTENGLTQFCQIVLYPGWISKNSPAKNFQQEWNIHVVKPTGVKAKPTSQTQNTPDGWAVVTGSANLTVKGMTYTCILVTITGFGKAMSVMVNTAGGDYATTIDKFFNDLNLDSKATVAANQANSHSTKNQLTMSNAITLNDYEFIAPEGWQVQNNKDHIAIQNMQSGCVIRMITPQPSSGSIEQDAKSVFETMYQGWQYQKSGEQQYTLTKGFFPKGLEYFMMQAGMSKLSADGSRYDGFEEGVAMVVKAGSQIVILSIRHNTSLMGHTDCTRKYETMRRFFNSFTIKNVAVTKNEEDAATRITGSWSMAEAGAAGEYVFAANGNYAFYGALGSTSTSRDYNYKYLQIKTYSFRGDGSYTIAGNQLTLKKRNRDPEQIIYRFEKVNHGGTGWKNRIWMMTRDRVGETEVCYEKKGEIMSGLRSGVID